MKRTLSVIAFAVLMFTVASRLLAQNPAVGTWKLNVAKSKYVPGPAPQSLTRTVEAEGDKVKYTFEGVAADGSSLAYGFTVAYDGKDYPVTGTAPGGADSISFAKPTAETYIATMKKGGKAILIARVRVSADGKVTTVNQASPSGKGSVKNLLVFEKQ